MIIIHEIIDSTICDAQSAEVIAKNIIEEIYKHDYTFLLFRNIKIIHFDFYKKLFDILIKKIDKKVIIEKIRFQELSSFDIAMKGLIFDLLL